MTITYDSNINFDRLKQKKIQLYQLKFFHNHFDNLKRKFDIAVISALLKAVYLIREANKLERKIILIENIVRPPWPSIYLRISPK
jgi:hypothetical protein